MEFLLLDYDTLVKSRLHESFFVKSADYLGLDIKEFKRRFRNAMKRYEQEFVSEDKELSFTDFAQNYLGLSKRDSEKISAYYSKYREIRINTYVLSRVLRYEVPVSAVANAMDVYPLMEIMIYGLPLESVTLSCVVGYRMPAEEIYEEALGGKDPSSVGFYSDDVVYRMGARRVGLQVLRI